jgi:F-type H+-transporting ATPase subunit c
MDRNLALSLIFSLMIIGPSFVFAAAAYASIQALGRNPFAAPKIMTAMMMTLIFTEAIAIISFLVVWQLFAVNG